MSGVKIATVADSISKLTVTGVTIKDIDGIPQEVLDRHCPIMFPEPDGYVTNLRVLPKSFGSGAAGKNDVSYSLNYVYLHTPVGSGRYVADNVVDMVNKTVLILNEIIENDAVTGSVDISPRISSEFGVLTDAAGNQFHGCLITIDVKEFYEV